jgi:MFS family permease
MSAITVTRQRTYSVSQRACLSAVFASVGMLIGTWASRIPAIQENLEISHSALSMVLLCGGLGGVLSCPLAARIMCMQGGRKTLFHGGMGVCVALIAIGMAPSVPLLMAAVLLLGLTAGCYTIGINAVASRYETMSGKSEMAMLHAWGCAGSLAGTLLGSLAATAHIKLSPHFVMVALPVAGFLWACYSMLELDSAAEPPSASDRKFSLPTGPLAPLGLLAFCTSLSNNGIADWGGIFLKEEFHVAAGFAPLALSVFTVMLLLGRLQGDSLKAKHRASRLVSLGASVSAAGLVFAVFAPNPYLALVGFACSGMGLSLAYPFVFSAVGKQGAMALAAVATMSNLGGLAGPLVMGTLADYLGMQSAIGFIGLLSIVIAVVASKSVLLRQQHATPA